MDNIFCDCVSRRRLCSEDHCDRTFRKIPFFDLFVFIDCIECIHLLSLVLMQTFDLNVKYRIGVNLHMLCPLQIIRKLLFGVHFDLS